MENPGWNSLDDQNGVIWLFASPMMMSRTSIQLGRRKSFTITYYIKEQNASPVYFEHFQLHVNRCIRLR